MQWRARVVAPVVAGILGVTGGVAAAQLVDGNTAPRTFADPLGLRVPLVNLPCDPDQAILVVGRGDGRPALDSGVANMVANHQDVRYLETARSCQTQMAAENARTKPTYVAYLGPYDSLLSACTLRMSSLHATDYVARLKPGNTELVKCPCVIPSDRDPVLTVEPRPSAYHNVWARSLQGMLHDDDATAFPRKRISGTYDAFTRDYIRQRFQIPAGYLGRNGLMDRVTWRIVVGRICAGYTY